MKRVYEVEMYFGYPWELHGMRRSDTYLVEAGSVATAAKLGMKVARRDRNGGYTPRIMMVKETGIIAAR